MLTISCPRIHVHSIIAHCLLDISLRTRRPDHVAVRTALEGVANVHRPNENCGPTINALEKLQGWLEQHGERPWDVIHFNFGCKLSTLLND